MAAQGNFTRPEGPAGMSAPASPSATIANGVNERFSRLAAEWKEQSRYLSNSAQMAMLEPYQRIIGMGQAAVPLILGELQREPDHWFWALEAITEQNPVPTQAAGPHSRPPSPEYRD
jgi:hypothetical protein